MNVCMNGGHTFIFSIPVPLTAAAHAYPIWQISVNVNQVFKKAGTGFWILYPLMSCSNAN